MSRVLRRLPAKASTCPLRPASFDADASRIYLTSLCNWPSQNLLTSNFDLAKPQTLISPSDVCMPSDDTLTAAQEDLHTRLLGLFQHSAAQRPASSDAMPGEYVELFPLTVPPALGLHLRGVQVD